jgi:hypothetical protein
MSVYLALRPPLKLSGEKRKDIIMGWSMKLISNANNLKISLILVIIVTGAAVSAHLLVVYAGGPETTTKADAQQDCSFL